MPNRPAERTAAHNRANGPFSDNPFLKARPRSSLSSDRTSFPAVGRSRLRFSNAAATVSGSGRTSPPCPKNSADRRLPDPGRGKSAENPYLVLNQPEPIFMKPTILLLAGVLMLALCAEGKSSRRVPANEPATLRVHDALFPAPYGAVRIGGYLGEKLDLCIDNRADGSGYRASRTTFPRQARTATGVSVPNSGASGSPPR